MRDPIILLVHLIGTLARVIRSAIVLRPSTILEFHRALRTRKYRWLFSPTRRRTGPKGPSKALVDAIVDMKRRNPRWGCPRIAQQIALAFAVDIDKDVVRRVLATHSRPAPHSGGPSWLTFLGHAKDSLWSIDLFRCESAILRSHWVLVVMDQYTRRIVGFGIHCTASGFLDSGLTVFASTPPRPARGGRVAPGPGFGSRTSPASTARCTSA